MIAQARPVTGRPDRPWYVWLGVAIELLTALTAIPVGLALMADPSGEAIGLPSDWISGSVFGTYLVPGLYLFAVNGVGMVVAAILSVRPHPIAPWLTGALGVGLVIWISVQLAIMPETMALQWVFLAAGLALGVIALFWLRRTRQVRQR